MPWFKKHAKGIMGRSSNSPPPSPMRQYNHVVSSGYFENSPKRRDSTQDRFRRAEWVAEDPVVTLRRKIDRMTAEHEDLKIKQQRSDEGFRRTVYERDEQIRRNGWEYGKSLQAKDIENVQAQRWIQGLDEQITSLKGQLSHMNEQAARQNREAEETHRVALESLEANHKDRIASLVEDHEKAKKTSERELEKAKSAARAEAQQMKDLHSKASKEMERVHATEMSDALRLQKRQEEALTKDHRTQMQALQARMQEMMEAHKTNTAEMIHTHKLKEEELVSSHQKETGGLHNRMEELERTHEVEMASLNENHQREVGRLEAQSEEMRADHKAEVSSLAEFQRAREEELARIHHENTRGLQLHVQKLNDALLSRDDEVYRGAIFSTSNLPSKPDTKIREDFSELAQMVDQLARTSWREDTSWPDKVLRRIASQHNPRLAKKAILQDMTWNLLFQFVFASPFRVFGEEGRVLEKEWLEECGNVPEDESKYSWPEAEFQTERWRYMTLKECREALMKPVPSQWDARARLKRCFLSTRDELVARLGKSLSAVVDLDEEHVQLIRRLSIKTANTWLEFAMHRCRIVVRMTGQVTKSTSDMISAMQQRPLTLTVLPTVGRYGNMSGLELDSFVHIEGCRGETLDIA